MSDYTRRPAGPGHSPTTNSAQPTGSPAAAATSQQSQPPSQHKRVYQACIPCRRRKVRCDLGSVDNPHDPPCVRCRRESKECYFSATRRKRKGDEELDPDGYLVDEYTVRNGRKRLYSGSAAGGSLSPTASIDRRLYSEVPLVPGASQHVRREPLRRPEGGGGSRSVASTTHTSASDRRSDFGPTIGEDSNAQLENFEAQTVMRQGVFGPHDALDLLYKAATDGRADHHHIKTDEPAAPVIPPVPPQPIINHPTPVPSRRNTRDSRSIDARSTKTEPTIDPALTKRNMADDPGYMEAIKAWSRFRFVRAGWFSAQEAIEYIDYYYKYLSPLTPISPPTFHNPGSHLTLLIEEPVLTVTLLTIASRFRQLEGTGGQCRANAIHEQLWTYLRGMIERCLWGQEAFGGGLFPPGSIVTDETQTSSTAPWRGLRKGSLRTLGTIESLMILTEWHPRALHFPAPEAIDELMLPSYERESNLMADDDGGPRQATGVGGKRIESWLEPAWRSDRMCWMLLSTATGLAYELGVFDDIDELLRDETITRPEYEEESYRQRAYRIKRLLLIYSTQLAGRLGWTNMVPESLRKSDPAVSRRRPTSVEGGGGGGATPGTNTSVLSNAFNYIPDLELDDQIIHCWAGITNAMHIGNEKLFRSRKYTAEIIQSGRYLDLLKEFQPLFRDWHKEFERFRLPPYTRHILTIEYEYVRIYVSSLSLQAVVERCTNNAGNTAAAAAVNAAAGANNGAPAQLSPQTQNYFGTLPLGIVGGFTAVDQEHIKEVVDGCRNLLRTVVEGLLPGGYLKHAPVRTYFRIISGAMFLLKTFALGAPRADVKLSIDLMDATVEALRNCVVDDVHLGIRFADLLESLTSRLRNRFIQAPTAGQVASADTRTPNPGGAMDGLATNGLGGPPDSSWAAITSKLREGLHADSPNISATPFDLTTGTFPYPSGAASALNPSTPAAGLDSATTNGVATANGNLAPGVASGATGAASLGAANANAGTAAGGGGAFDDWNNPDNEMWYLPPGPAFFQNMDNSMVEMTAEGVSVGGLDLLEYMVMDSAPQYGTGPFGA